MNGPTDERPVNITSGRVVVTLRGVPTRCESCGLRTATHMVMDPGMPVALVCQGCSEVAA